MTLGWLRQGNDGDGRPASGSVLDMGNDTRRVGKAVVFETGPTMTVARADNMKFVTRPSSSESLHGPYLRPVYLGLESRKLRISECRGHD